MLTSEEIERYKRHLVLKQVGGSGQQKLKAAKVLVIGAGGLGSPVLLYLAAAGVGTIGIIDDDTVSLSNLQRQIIHKTEKVGTPKVDSAEEELKTLNPHIRVIKHNERLTSENAFDIISTYDIVADGSDNFETRYLVNDTCFHARVPLVFAALGTFDGYLTTFRAFEKNEEGIPNPSYRCLFPEAPEPGTVPNCSEVGILGAVAGVLGTLQATEILKEILGIGDSLVGQLIIYDALSTRFERMNYKWDPGNILNGEAT
ncbi:MAG: HesA/MoeB/ThiF family protein [Methyloligellaceae bacterium]